MSRSYRFRHGWHKPHGVNYTQARMRHVDDKYEEELYYNVAHIRHNQDCVVGTIWPSGRKVQSHMFCLPRSSEYCNYFTVLSWRQRAQYVASKMQTRNVWSNLHVGYGAQFGSAKKQYRTEGNRRGRRRDKYLCREWARYRDMTTAYDMRLVPAEQCEHTCDECATQYFTFVTDDACATQLEREVSRKHTNWDNCDLT